MSSSGESITKGRSAPSLCTETFRPLRERTVIMGPGMHKTYGNSNIFAFYRWDKGDDVSDLRLLLSDNVDAISKTVFSLSEVCLAFSV